MLCGVAHSCSSQIPAAPRQPECQVAGEREGATSMDDRVETIEEQGKVGKGAEEKRIRSILGGKHSQDRGSPQLCMFMIGPS
ncbi:hypothetical protein X777_01902 [Ooceraea biroi]|uniref:Uncharacterized protein n=1 Tax=Ooceraea biroi TaxID=2015173 RepID=A0A026WR61_OOCBI|nr:hypothetical protein X777_01902 [Ooceraea biroi]